MSMAYQKQKSFSSAGLVDGLESLEQGTDDWLFTRLGCVTASRIADVVQLNRNPVRAAGFRVLRAPDIPSVLIEIGYLSSKNDIDLLTSADWRDRTSERLAAGINEFISRTRVNAVQTPPSP